MEQIFDTLKINGVEYVQATAVNQEVVEFTGEESIASRMIGKKVIVRSYNDGVNAGIVVLADETGVELKNCRRLWAHRPKDENLSWCEGVAISGLASDSKVSCTVDTKIIVEDYSMILCRDVAFKSIMEMKPHAQS